MYVNLVAAVGLCGPSGETFHRLPSHGTMLAFSYVTSGGLRSEIAEDLILNGVPQAGMFESTDTALEYFEEGILMKIGAGQPYPGVPARGERTHSRVGFLMARDMVGA